MILYSRGILALHQQVRIVVQGMWGASPEAAAEVTLTIAERTLAGRSSRYRTQGMTLQGADYN